MREIPNDFTVVGDDLFVTIQDSGIPELIIRVDGFRIMSTHNKFYLKINDVVNWYKREIPRSKNPEELEILKNNLEVYSKYLEDFKSGEMKVVENVHF